MPPLVYVTRRAHFSAAHRLFNPSYSNERNDEVFDKCANPNGHGHNYYVEVTVAGSPDPETGYVIDLKRLKKIMDEHFIAHVDHKHLNVDVAFMRGINPTAENIAIACWEQLEPHLGGSRLFSVRIYETEQNFSEYKGEHS
ncbi:MAG TPA: 6-carboxytetrahydropterin synthase [Bacteroidota bacterium]|nr:6-carboxytetrahydropterin synthase [Bacteroidota bacterium]